MAIAPGTTLADYVLPARARRSQQLVRDGILVIGFSIVVALSAQVAIPLPFTPVPITLQTLAVLLTGAALGSKRGGLAMLLYLAEGAAGLPVFAHGLGGFIYLVGTDAGYLWACPIAALVVGLLCERGLDRSYLTSLLAMLPGTIIFYVLGATWLGIVLHLTVALSFADGISPFIPGDLLKIVIAAALVPAAWQIIRMVRPDLKNTKGTI
ncbi:biotin transporter BioY [Ktedonobacteria bacterium brp13]|nr:biotin transporter BioY [Ktedonobacteria bacterium brp13]